MGFRPVRGRSDGMEVFVIEARKSVRGLKPYSPPLEGRRGYARLDFNENTAGFPGVMPGLPDDAVSAYPEYGSFKARLAGVYGVPEECVLLTNGSGEALFTAAFTFIEPGERAVTSAPTFPLIPHSLRLAGADLAEVPVDRSLEFDVGRIEEELCRGVKLAAFASPDNPTGAVLGPGVVEGWCKRFPGTLFLVDEAYAEYCGSSLMASAAGLGNLLASRTFSKAWALAGLRLGALVGSKRLVDEMAKVRSPYSVNSAALFAASALLPRKAEVEAAAAETMRRKDRLVAAVEARGFRVKKGSANFFLLMAGLDAAALVSHAKSRGTLLRDRSVTSGLPGAVRVTVGTDPENARLLEALDGFRAGRALVFDLDETLVETRETYDVVVGRLVLRHSGKPVDRAELQRLRASGGFNDDWDSTVEILRRRGVAITRGQVDAEGKAAYLAIAAGRERMLIDRAVLEALGKRYRLFLHTGRSRDEYAPVWGGDLDPLFESVTCRGDDPGLAPKPAPDQLVMLLSRAGCSGGVYVGNSVDDMAAAKAAGFFAIGVATTMDRGDLLRSGADLVAGTAAEAAALLGVVMEGAPSPFPPLERGRG